MQILVDHFAAFLSDNSFFASLLRLDVKFDVIDYLMASKLFLVLQRCSELLGYVNDGNAKLWAEKAEEYINQLEIGHEILLSFPSLNNTLVIRAINETDREIAIISLDDKAYFATVEQHINYGGSYSKSKSSKKKTDETAQSDAKGNANEEAEDNIADDFEKNFIAVISL